MIPKVWSHLNLQLPPWMYLRYMWTRHDGTRLGMGLGTLMVGLDDLKDVFQPQ